MKGSELKKAVIIAVALLSAVLGGCGGVPEGNGGLLLSVDWHEGETLRYKFVSDRQAEIDWSTMGGKAADGPGKTAEYSESLEMVISYSPVEINPYGLTTIKATCESLKTHRVSDAGRGARGQDAANSLTGKSFTLKIAPSGKIEDYSSLEEVLYEAGEKSIHQTAQGRVKDPDMTADFIASQWFLWDTISSIKNIASGVNVGDTWESVLSMPTPMILKKARAVTYQLAEIRQSEEGEIAVIRSSYALAPDEQYPWPLPYQGSFRPSGTFGFLQNYKVEELSGQGEELFNIEKGHTESYGQNYEVKMTAGFMMRLPGRVGINIKQKLTMELLAE